MRRQVALLVAATTSLVVLAFLLPLALLLQTLAEDRAVAAGLQEAQGLAVVAAVVTDPAQLAPVVELADGSSPREVSVVLPGGAVVGAPVPAGSPSLDLAARGTSAVVEVAAGREVLVPVEGSAGRAVVRSLVPDAELRRGVLPAVLALAGLGVALLAVAVLVADRLARGTVRPVVDLARTAHALAGGDLTARVEPAGPQEVREVAAALNGLAGRTTELLAAEREAAADLSHRLRTPMTALRLEVEALPAPGAERVVAGLAALDRAVDDVIRSARRPVREGAAARCDAGAVVGERVAFWAVLAEDQGRAVEVELAPGPLPVRLLGEDLAAAVDALVGNVLSHTPDGTPLSVTVRRRDDAVEVSVADRGPGMSASAPVRGRSGAGSTGLGLDIARRTATAAGGRLVLRDRRGGGARVTLVAPLLPPPGGA